MEMRLGTLTPNLDSRANQRWIHLLWKLQMGRIYRELTGKGLISLEITATKLHLREPLKEELDKVSLL